MFSAKWISQDQLINSLDPRWVDGEDILREGGKSGDLACPHCQNEVVFRKGTVKRSHFAHKTLETCPLAKQSPEVLEAKAQLYGLLRTKRLEKVEMEVQLNLADKTSAFIDILVQHKGRNFGYFLFDRAIRLRHLLKDACIHQGITPVFIHTDSAFRLQPEGELLLHKSLRDLRSTSKYDDCDWSLSHRSHLTFLITASKELRIYRGLACIHEPNVYEWSTRRIAPLDEVKFDPNNGELIVQEDIEARKRFKEEQRKLEEEKKRREEEAAQRIQAERLRLAKRANDKMAASSAFRPHSFTSSPAVPQDATHPQTISKSAGDTLSSPEGTPDGNLRCRLCGTYTKDWVHSNEAEGTCLCHRCFQKMSD
ncbi:MAG: hypothetical protein JJU29_07065 [Verrucomicrobia bacterium]|nr:hypothetical protein [Verrucomicrobiota bacterium]MCH8510778.1 hypothetical protein [Kiritimatiellia bacterium]